MAARPPQAQEEQQRKITEEQLREAEEAEAQKQRLAREREDAWRAEQDGLRVLHTQAEPKLPNPITLTKTLTPNHNPDPDPDH